MRKKEIVGLLFLIVGAAGIYLSVQRSAPEYIYLIAKRDITPGEIISSSDLVRKSMNLSESSNLYLSGDAKFQSRRTLRRIGSGEAIPRDALTAEVESESRRLITFSLPKNRVPSTLSSGDLADIYFFNNPEFSGNSEKISLIKIFEKIRVKSVDRQSTQLDGSVTLTAYLEESDAIEFATLLASSVLSLAQRFDDVG